MSLLDNKTIQRLSKKYLFEDNKMVIDYINSNDDEVALHGLYHTDYSLMSYKEQFNHMKEGLEILRQLFPGKKINYFIPPFNRRNPDTYRAAKENGIMVLGDDGVHLEESINDLKLEPGIWYRYHHHRFYPSSKFATIELNFNILDCALAKSSISTVTYKSIPSHNYPLDITLLKTSIEKHNAQEWYYNTALDRLSRIELAIAMDWIYSYVPYEKSIYELGCGSGNNLAWLSVHGYTNLGGSDIDDKALKVANDMSSSIGAQWSLDIDDILIPKCIPSETYILLALNCTYLLDDFDIASFLEKIFNILPNDAYLIIDQIDASFNSRPKNEFHSSDWSAEQHIPRKSEYRVRYSLGQIFNFTKKLNLYVVRSAPIFATIPRVVYAISRCRTFPDPPLQLPRQTPEKISYLETANIIFRSGLFDWKWYRENYVHGPEIMDPLIHFIKFGAAKGYNPNEWFDTNTYRNRYMDYMDNINPLLHFLIYKNMT
jgi:peptidoglycan/xylan/chitin deacetylase (PgdA/CDA1 family)